MATLEEVFRDRTQFPDEQTITIGGQELTMKQFREQALPKSDATRFGQQARQEADAIKQRAEQLEQALLDSQQKIALLSQQSADAYQSGQDDPYTAQLRQMQERQEHIIKRLQEHETGFYLSEYNRQLDRLAEKDKSLDRKQLVDFAKSRQIMNLEDAYRLLHHDRLTKEASEKAASEAREKALKEARAPRLAFPGIRPKREASAPTWKDAENAESDPEMWAAFESPTQH